MVSRIVMNPPWELSAPTRSYQLLTGQRAAEAWRGAVTRTQAASNPGRSAVWRSAQFGDWRHEIDPPTKDSFKLVAGDLLDVTWDERDLDC